MSKCEIKELIADSIRGQITRSLIEDAICTAIGEFDFTERISMAMEDAIGTYVSDYVSDLADEVIEEVISDAMEDYFN